jgi:endoplasmic reticulum-Golgi intermediate compartment protein 3
VVDILYRYSLTFSSHLIPSIKLSRGYQLIARMSLQEKLKTFDAHSPVSSEFRVYTLQGAVLSVVTVLIIVYLVLTEALFNFQVTMQESVHVNATSSRGLEMEFDISLLNVPCDKLSIDASDPHGQSQSLHLDKEHHVWKHRIRMSDDGRTKRLIGEKVRLELGSTLRSERDLVAIAEEDGKIRPEEYSGEDGKEEEKCGSCYGAGEEGECCNTCEDVRRAYKRRGWILRTEFTKIEQCEVEDKSTESQDGEGCNVHGVVALSTGGGNLHLAPGREAATGAATILDLLMQSFQEWDVTHEIHKIRFGPEYPAAVYQLDGEKRKIEDTFGMYQYYFQVRTCCSPDRLHVYAFNPCTARPLPNSFYFMKLIDSRLFQRFTNS